MDYRKTEKTNLENKKGVFFLIGALLILTITFASFSIKSYSDQAYNFEMQVDEEMMELPPVTTPPPPPPPPPPPAVADPVQPIIKLVENEVKTEDPKFDEIDINEIEVNDNPVSEEPAAVTDELEETPLFVVSNDPSSPECANLKTNEERKNCTFKSIMSFISQNYVTPDIARELGVGGTIYVRFTIDKSGNVKDVQILKGVNEYLDKEAIKTISKLPKFKPASHMDRPVSLYYQIPLKIDMTDN